jgi:hypothetical protein
MTGQQNHDDFVIRAKARIAEMSQAAEDLAKELGLPAELKYALLGDLYAEQAHSLLAAADGQQVVETRDEASLRSLVHQLTSDFIRSQMKELLPRLETYWEILRPISSETLGKGLHQPGAPLAALGFADPSDQLLVVISVVAWAATTWPNLARSLSAEETTLATINQARSRGLPGGLSRRLAQFLQEKLLTGSD